MAPVIPPLKNLTALVFLQPFLRALDHVLDLRKKAFGMDDRPDNAAEYDRKIWSHQCVVKLVTIKQDATNYVYWLIMAGFLVKGLRHTELLKCFKPVVLVPDKFMEDAMTQTAYIKMMNDVGDIYEAIAAIANPDTPKSAQVRASLNMSDEDALRIVSHLSSLAEYTNLLLRRCSLSEKQVRDELGLGHQVELLHALYLEEHDETRPALKRTAPVVDSDAETESISWLPSDQAQPRTPPLPPWRRPSSSASNQVQSSQPSQPPPIPPLVPPVPAVVALRPPSIPDTRFSHIKASKKSKCDFIFAGRRKSRLVNLMDSMVIGWTGYPNEHFTLASTNLAISQGMIIAGGA